MYLPSTRSTREVATSRQSESFMGSDFTYRDMGAQDFHGYTYEYLGEETVGQVSCHKLERRPTDDGSGYDHQVVWLDTEAYRVLRVDYFDGANELLNAGARRIPAICGPALATGPHGHDRLSIGEIDHSRVERILLRKRADHRGLRSAPARSAALGSR